MQLTPITRRPARWISFALAIMLALQFVSPLVRADEPSPDQSVFARVDSVGSGGFDEEFSSEDELLEDELEDWELEEDFERALDSMPVLDSLPRIGGSYDWTSDVKLTVKLTDKSGKETFLYDPAQSPPAPVDTPYVEIGTNTHKLTIAVDFKMDNESTGEKPNVSKNYIIKVSNNLVDFGDIAIPDNPVLKCTPTQTGEPDHPAIIITMHDTAADESLLNAQFNLNLTLNPVTNDDPANPSKVPIINTDQTGPIEIYPVGVVTDPKIKKSDGDTSGIAISPHPVKWTVDFRTGRRMPAGVPGYTERTIILTDQVDADQQYFDASNIDLKLDGVAVSSTATAPAIPRYEISADQSTLTVYLKDLPDDKDVDTYHQLTYTTCVTTNYFENKQEQKFSNSAKLTGGKKDVSDTGDAYLPKWIAKEDGNGTKDQDRIDTYKNNHAGVPVMPIAWTIRVNPKKNKVSVPQGTTLIDDLPAGLMQLISVRDGRGNDLFVPQENINSDNGWSLTGGTNNATGELNPSATSSGKLTYTYPAIKDLTGGAGAAEGEEQVFTITALVDLSGIGGNHSVGQKFNNSAYLKLFGATGNGYKGEAPEIGVEAGSTLLHKEGKLDANHLKDRTITWTIDVNNLKREITDNPYIEDKPGAGQFYVPGSFTIDSGTPGNFKLFSKNGIEVTPSTDADAGINAGDGFYWQYDFGTASINTSYKITYQTYVVHTGNYPNGKLDETRTNKVILKNTKGDVAKDDASVKLTTTLLSKGMVSYNPIPDEEDTDTNKRRLIKWQVTVNQDGAFLKNPTFSDPLQSGLVYKPGTFIVTDPNGGATTEPDGFAYDPVSATLSYSFKDFLQLPNPPYYPDGSAKGIAGKYIITFETYVPESLWQSNKTGGSSDLSNAAKLSFDGKEVSAKADVTIKNPTIKKSSTTGKDSIGKYFDWTILLNQNAAKVDETTIIDHLPTGMAIFYTHPDAQLPKLTAHKIKQSPSTDNPSQLPGYESTGTEIPLILGKNCFYEPCTDGKNGTTDVHDLRIELKDLQADYPDCILKLTVRTWPTKELNNAKNMVTMTGFGVNTHEGSSEGFNVIKNDADGNGSSMSGNLTVEKLLVETDDTSTIASGIEFSLYTPTSPPRLAGVQTTGVSGTCDFTKLRIGQYDLEETSAHTGYWNAGSQRVELTSSTPLGTAKVKNYANQIIVVKQDANVNLPLAGAQFQLYTNAGIKVQGVKTTDAKGMCGWEKLAEGEYYIEEIAAPEGYALSDVKKSAVFEISRTTLPEDAVLTDADATTANGEYLVNMPDTAWKTPAFVFEFSNARTGSVSIEKHDDATSTPLAGAQFGLYQSGNNLPLEAKATGADGKLAFETALADKTTYEVREQLAPEGYLLGGYSETFTTDFANQSADQRKYAFSAANTKNRVDCEKTDNFNADKKLAGAVFGLYRADGTLISTATSDENGTFSFAGVPAGAYIQEITPPAGYQLDTKTRYTPGLNAGSAENPPLYTFKNTPTPSSGGGGGGGGGETPLLPPKHPSSSSSSSSSASSGAGSGTDESSSSRPWPPVEDEYGQVSPDGMTSDEVGRLLDEGYRPTRDVPFGLTREQVIKMILDENIPLGRLPATGDTAGRVVFPLIFMGLSSAYIAGVIISRRKKRNQV